ncbi:flagellar hook-associated protein FlgK [Bacillus sp. S/N-304-OC-R1]|uniref:flagellar hook-associated protein FlgK n=1 Tax=Bacillus sp. S/N-304-OC-R1 TaxID=2758034 RepID=UPI001C8ECB11|nr:flagellar hook-associated protein FlgK [Bacillus sp. S/N-304-OC-R1]MBY0123469.1 flagellar hook-associated protein FlgK [Bacillus sp. S/N-304-OC-R1]
MISTFHGLEVAKRGMQTQQAALYVTGHNISNANTPGYTRQRVNFAQTNPFPSPALNRPQIPGQMGTGVYAESIQRLRDSFVDMQFQTESSKLGYWQAKSEMLTQMENIMNEPSDTGLAHTLDEFWNALQDLAVQPQNDGARRVVRERGISLANTFNYTYDSLKAIQKDYRKEIDVTQDSVNSLLRQINQINKQIGSVEPHGYLPNDLYDERDRLIDDLSALVNIKVDRQPSGGLASAKAEGLLDIYLTTPQGDVLKDSNGRPIKLIDSKSNTAVGIHITYENRSELDSPVEGIKFFELKENNSGFVGINTNIEADSHNKPVYELNQFSDFNTNGRLKGFIEGYGYKYDPTPADKTNNDIVVKGTYNDMLAELDQMVFTFASHFNLVHQSGWSLNEIRDGENKPIDFFSLGTATENNFKGIAGKIKVSDAIMEDVQNIAAAAEGNVLAGTFDRKTVDKNTVGNPVFTGIYNSETVPAGWENAKDIEVNLQYTGGKWQYQVKAKDAAGSYLTPEPTGFSDFISNPETIYGIKLDVSNVSNQSNGDIWSVSFTAKGMSAKDEAFIGNGSNALKLANVKDAVLNYGGNLTSVQTFYQGMVGRLGDSASEALRMENTASVLKESVEFRRMSISNVSLDEEMTNLIKFQHAYNAAARNITMIDEMLDKIINGMGVVGR